ncbi:hypothetical protein ANRL4_01642 [Anaerolineae bacterium]|nr:hypothetical protein ANRL4_01642 [Anaerolineae bacterium]
MTDVSLLEQIESLRTSYGVRQRNLKSLIGALQTLHKDFGKTLKLLDEYSRSGDSSPTGLGSALETLGQTNLKNSVLDVLLPDFRRELKVLIQITNALKDSITALDSNSIDVVRLGKSCTALSKIKNIDENLSQILLILREHLSRAETELATTFGESLRNAFAAQGISVGGRPPLIEVGRFEIALDFQSRHAALRYGKETLTQRIHLSTEEILKAYGSAQKTIINRNEDGDAWMRLLHIAWENVHRSRMGSDRRANVVDCYFEMVLLRQKRGFRAAPSKTAFTDYSRAQFAYDLDTFVNRQRRGYLSMRPSLHVSIKANTDNPEKSLWLVEGSTPHEGRYIGDLIFEKSE